MKILLIDDSNLSRTILKRALGEEYQCQEAVDGASGLELYSLEKPDLVILDLTMPDMNGLEVLLTIKQMDPNAKVIIGTADIQDFSRIEAEDLGASGYIYKPFTVENIRAVVKQVLAAEEK